MHPSFSAATTCSAPLRRQQRDRLQQPWVGGKEITELSRHEEQQLDERTRQPQVLPHWNETIRAKRAGRDTAKKEHLQSARARTPLSSTFWFATTISSSNTSLQRRIDNRSHLAVGLHFTLTLPSPSHPLLVPSLELSWDLVPTASRIAEI